MHFSVLIVTLCLFSFGNCIKWHMQPNSYKCLREEIRANDVVAGVYEVTTVEGQQINYVVSILCRKSLYFSRLFKLAF